MVWIFWGTKTSDVCLGKVADVCPFCDGFRVFIVTDHYCADHVQGIRTQDWRWVGSSRKCTSCNSELVCKTEVYNAFIATDEAIPFDQLLQKTNRRLASKLEKEARQEIGQTGGKRGDAAGATPTDPEFASIADSLATVDSNDPEILKLREKIKHWNRLNRDQQAAFSSTVKALCERKLRVAQVKEFVKFELMNHSPSADRLGCVLALAVLVGALVAMFFLPVPWDWCLGTTYVFAAFGVAGFTLFSYFSIATFEDPWFSKVFIPRAKEKQIQLDFLFEVLVNWSVLTAEEKEHPRLSEPAIRHLASSVAQELGVDYRPTPEANP